MGFFDRIKALFGEREETQSQPRVTSSNKRDLCEEIIEIARQITIKDSFNQTAARYANANVYFLENMKIKYIQA